MGGRMRAVSQRTFGGPEVLEVVEADLSGVVEATGDQATRFRPGERVHGVVLPPRGSYAEYVAVPAGRTSTPF